MKYAMLFEHKRGAGICEITTRELEDYFTFYFLRLICLFKIKIKVLYFVKKNFEGWEKEDYGKTKEVIPIKIFLNKKYFNRETKIKKIQDYFKKENKKIK